MRKYEWLPLSHRKSLDNTYPKRVASHAGYGVTKSKVAGVSAITFGKISATILVGLTVFGCAQTKLVRPGATADEVRTDNAQCEFEAVRAAPLQSGGAVELAFSRAEITRSCLLARGYFEVSAAEARPTREPSAGLHREAPPIFVASANLRSGEQSPQSVPPIVNAAPSGEDGTSGGNGIVARLMRARDDYRECIVYARNDSAFSGLLHHLSNVVTEKPDRAEFSDEQIPTVAESRLLLSYWNQTSGCRYRAMTAISEIAPGVGGALAEGMVENGATMALLIERQITWAVAAKRENITQETMSVKLHSIHL